jgi:predicted DNA-binding protein
MPGAGGFIKNGTEPGSRFLETIGTNRVVCSGAQWCILDVMATMEKAVRQSISLPSRLAKRVRALAKNQRTSANRVLVELIETGLESKEAEKRRFFELADQLSASTDTAEQQRIKGELARLTFGE